MLHSSKGIPSSSKKTLSLVPIQRWRFFVLSDDVASCWVVMMLSALQERYLEGLAWVWLINLTLYFMVILEVRKFIIYTLQKGRFLYVVTRREIFWYCVDFGRPFRDNCRIAVTVIRHLFLYGTFQYLQRSVHSSFTTNLLSIDMYSTRFDDINPLHSLRLI